MAALQYDFRMLSSSCLVKQNETSPFYARGSFTCIADCRRRGAVALRSSAAAMSKCGPVPSSAWQSFYPLNRGCAGGSTNNSGSISRSYAGKTRIP
jgi:hypothetical protein